MKTYFNKVVHLAIMVLLFASLVACSDQAELTPLPANATILAFGDSLTSGVGTTPQHSYPSILAQLTGLNVVNGGVSGNTTSQALKRLPKLLQQTRPNLVIICLGGNDIIKKVPKATIINNLKNMIVLSEASGAQVVLVAVPELGLSLRVPDYFEEIAKEFHIPIAENTLRDLLKQAKYKSDPIHLNQQGYYLMAENILQLLQDSGAVQK